MNKYVSCIYIFSFSLSQSIDKKNKVATTHIHARTHTHCYKDARFFFFVGCLFFSFFLSSVFLLSLSLSFLSCYLSITLGFLYFVFLPHLHMSHSFSSFFTCLHYPLSFFSSSVSVLVSFSHPSSLIQPHLISLCCSLLAAVYRLSITSSQSHIGFSFLSCVLLSLLPTYYYAYFNTFFTRCRLRLALHVHIHITYIHTSFFC